MHSIDTKGQVTGTISTPQQIVGQIKERENLGGSIFQGQDGTSNYERLKNKPLINDVVLIGNKKSKELKLQPEMSILTNSEIKNLIKF